MHKKSSQRVSLHARVPQLDIQPARWLVSPARLQLHGIAACTGGALAASEME